jgi:haloalkane dehalogenase
MAAFFEAIDKKDFAFQEPERLRFEKLFTDHKTILLANAGHFIQEDSPDEIVQAIRQWFTNEKKAINS